MGSGFTLDMIKGMVKNASLLRSKRRKFEDMEKLQEFPISHEHHDIRKMKIGESDLREIKTHIREDATLSEKKKIRSIVFSLIIAGIITAIILFIIGFLYRTFY